MERGNSGSFTIHSRTENHSVDSVDRISDLPISVIGHILSFLPIKNAVATHILSQRWKFLWTTIVNLDFQYPKCYLGKGQFVRFVTFVLSLTWKTSCIPLHVNTWISVGRNVHELIVHVSASHLQIQVLRSMFTSEALRSLELNSKICITPEIVVSFPRLESLTLISVYFQSKEDFRELLGGCPVLRDLYIDMDIGEMMKYLHLDIDDGVAFEYIVSSTSLRRLEIYARDEHKELEGTSLCSVLLDAPLLEYVKLDGQISSIFIQQERLTSLVEADVQLVYLESVSKEQNYCNSVVEAICALDCAKTLSLSAQVSRAISCATTKMRTTFDKLKRLEMKIDWNYWSSLQDFIELSDNLAVLTIRKDYDSSGGHFNDKNWENPKGIPWCVLCNLRTVSMEAYDGHRDELAMIGYILRHGTYLEVLQISFGKSFKDLPEFKVLQDILMLPRKSLVCEVDFRK